MTHYSDDDLVLYYYGEARSPAGIDRHLETCPTCAAAYREIVATLALVTRPNPPERGAAYGVEVWQRIRNQLPEQDTQPWTPWIRTNRWSLAAAAAVLIATAFAAGRLWSPPGLSPNEVAQSTSSSAGAPRVDGDDWIRLAETSEHLERSERMLLEIVNAEDDGIDRRSVDVSDQQAWADDLIDANRLFRQAATHAGDTATVGVLDELERSLLEIAHGPSSLSPAELQAIRLRLDAAALLFKVRVLSDHLADELHEREVAPVKPRKTT